MTIVTNEMISAAHGVTMKHGIVLSWEMLRDIYLSMDGLANQEKTSGSPKPAKTEALRLADAMEYDLDWCDEAAAELRRMHDLLGKANALCRIRAEEIERLKAQPEQEPVAFICEFYADEGHPFVSFEPVTHGTNTPLYSTPPQRKPLTDEEIDKLPWEPHESNPMTFAEGLRYFARAIEAAHGIKE